MQVIGPSAAAHRDNMLGICAALGRDFGFDPLWLRIALGAGILWNPAIVVGTYLALGLLVLATRVLFPDRQPVMEPVAPAAIDAANACPAGLPLAA